MLLSSRMRLRILGQVFARNDVHVAAGHRRIVVEAEQAANLFQAEAEFASSTDEAQSVDLGRAVYSRRCELARARGPSARALDPVVATDFTLGSRVVPARHP